MAIKGFLGSASWDKRYSRRAPEQIASTMSLIVTPRLLEI